MNNREKKREWKEGKGGKEEKGRKEKKGKC